MSIPLIQEIIDKGIKLTPMMEQYYSIKKNHLDHILFFRMGDFYEVFFEDAAKASKILNIALTHRGKIGDTPIPMAGIPHHAAANYIERITSQGLKVAICEQIEDPKEAKGIVARAVTQVVSPGMPFDLDRTDASEHRFMVSGSMKDGRYYLVAMDFTTGEFSGNSFETSEEFIEKLRLYRPKEFIQSMGQWDHLPAIETLLEQMGILQTHLSEEYFTPKYTEIYIEKIIPHFKRDNVLGQHPEILSPIGALSYYICSTQKGEDFKHIRPFRLNSEKGQMKVTLPTLTGLEILPKSRETYKESLLGYLDKTQTAMGSRMLKTFFSNPLNDLELIESRQKLIEYFMGDDELLSIIRSELLEVRDLERILAKISTGKANGGDLLNLASATGIYFDLVQRMDKKSQNLLGKFSKKDWQVLMELAETINKTINDEIGANLEKGNLIKKGCSKKRDRLAKLAYSAKDELINLEERYRNETGIPKLRVKSNNVAGYFIEVSKTHSNKVPKEFNRRQTLVNSERYTTEELSNFEKEVISSKEKLERLEREIFKDLTATIMDKTPLIQELASQISRLDVFHALTWMAIQEDFTKPRFNKKKNIILSGAWHPLIKSAIKDQFVPHDLTLNEDNFFALITGPNMAGKTTVMREVAIIQLMAQIGSFVPAEKAELGLCDYLFSRLGASDDILKGQSTFMVEMAETAEILRHATDKSLIILDEVGRGTSTYDGLSIAWSLVENFVQKTKALCLFATHYHELIELTESLEGAKNLTVETENHGGDVQFLYRLAERGANQSFGIYVAKLAGLPEDILFRSREILQGLEHLNQGHGNLTMEKGSQLSFFEESESSSNQVPDYLREIEDHLSSMDILRMTPLEALQKLDQLKQSALNKRLQ